MSIISLGKLDKTLIVIFVGCIICFLNRLLNQYDCELNKNPMINNIVISPSRFLTVIPFIILKIRNKRMTTNAGIEKSNINQIKLIYNDSEKIYAKSKWKFIILSGIIYAVEQTFFVYSFDIKTNTWMLYILIASIFYYMIYKVKLYRHHYITIILIILIGLIIDLVTGYLQDEIINKTYNLMAKLIKEILFSLFNVLAKYTMEKKYVSVYEFSFYVGLIILILFIIFAVFDYYYFGLNDYDRYFNNFNRTELLVIFGVIFTQLGINLTTLFTSKNNTPCHLFIIFLFGVMAYHINFEGYAPLIIICLIIILFLSLIFNEIIEINVFGMSYNTKRNIINRASNEDIILVKTIDEEFENDGNQIELKNVEIYK